MLLTDDELTAIYNEANGVAEGKRPTITTARIFAAMRLVAIKASQQVIKQPAPPFKGCIKHR